MQLVIGAVLCCKCIIGWLGGWVGRRRCSLLLAKLEPRPRQAAGVSSWQVGVQKGGTLQGIFGGNGGEQALFLGSLLAAELEPRLRQAAGASIWQVRCCASAWSVRLDSLSDAIHADHVDAQQCTCKQVLDAGSALQTPPSSTSNGSCHGVQ
jgi:type IV secretory pathway TrbD component